MKFAVVAYPRMEPASLQVIESFRASHDPLASFIRAHVTLVFPVDAEPEAFVEEARSIAALNPAFAVNLSAVRASVGIDGRAYALLEPDAGGETVSALHDRLYAGVLARHLLPDVAYEPHMTVASCQQLAECEAMASEFNASWRPAVAHIDELVMVDIGGVTARTAAVFPLKR